MDGKLIYPKGNPEALNRKETKNGLQMTAKYSAKQIGELLGGEDWFEKHPTSSCGHYQYWQVIPELVMVVADKSLVPDTPSMSCCRLQVAQTPASDFESKLLKLFCDILSSLQLHGTCSNVQMFVLS